MMLLLTSMKISKRIFLIPLTTCIFLVLLWISHHLVQNTLLPLSDRGDGRIHLHNDGCLENDIFAHQKNE